MPLNVSSGVNEYLTGLTDSRVDFASDIAFETADDIALAHALSGRFNLACSLLYTHMIRWLWALAAIEMANPIEVFHGHQGLLAQDALDSDHGVFPE